MRMRRRGVRRGRDRGGVSLLSVVSLQVVLKSCLNISFCFFSPLFLSLSLFRILYTSHPLSPHSFLDFIFSKVQQACGAYTFYYSDCICLLHSHLNPFHFSLLFFFLSFLLQTL